MNKYALSLTAAVILAPAIASAAPYYSPGFVNVNPNVLMNGYMNVRWNSTIPGSPYMGASGAAGGPVSFFGRDSENDTFSCIVDPGTSLYEAAVDIKNNLKDGNQLYVTKSSTSNSCTSITLHSLSYAQQ